ncbi:MAG: metallophosphoesterase [Acutalibacteraceae bacterium]
MKKALSALLSAVLILLLLLPVYAENGDELRFGSDGRFSIMVFSDIHEGGTGGGDACMQIMREALDKYAPDLVVFLGDNSIGETLEEHRAVIEKITLPERERNIPFAVIFGNHDAQEEDVTKEALLEIYREYGCVSYDCDGDLYGCGNCNIPILSSKGDKVKFNLWFFDSGADNPDSSVDGYDYIRENQLEWYKETALSLKERNGGETVPALAFQHIPVPEIYDKAFRELPFSLGGASYNGYNGKSYSLIPRLTGYEGIFYENAASPYFRTKELDTMRETGDVMAVFSGHDHVNAYKVNLDGIDWVSVPTVHNKEYSNDGLRGAGLITLDENNTSSYEYELVRACKLCMEEGSKICEMSDSTDKFTYFISGLFTDAVLSVQKALNTVGSIITGSLSC